jgi:hypothetical protein
MTWYATSWVNQGHAKPFHVVGSMSASKCGPSSIDTSVVRNPVSVLFILFPFVVRLLPLPYMFKLTQTSHSLKFFLVFCKFFFAMLDPVGVIPLPPTALPMGGRLSHFPAGLPFCLASCPLPRIGSR